MRLWYRVLFLNLWMLIFGPLACASTSAVTAIAASWSASCVTFSPSTRSTAGSETSSPGAAGSFSTDTTSPTDTRYCLPPVLTMAYIGVALLGSGESGSVRRARNKGPPLDGPPFRIRHAPYGEQSAACTASRGPGARDGDLIERVVPGEQAVDGQGEWRRDECQYHRDRIDNQAQSEPAAGCPRPRVVHVRVQQAISTGRPPPERDIGDRDQHHDAAVDDRSIVGCGVIPEVFRHQRRRPRYRRDHEQQEQIDHDSPAVDPRHVTEHRVVVHPDDADDQK